MLLSGGLDIPDPLAGFRDVLLDTEVFNYVPEQGNGFVEFLLLLMFVGLADDSREGMFGLLGDIFSLLLCDRAGNVVLVLFSKGIELGDYLSEPPLIAQRLKRAFESFKFILGFFIGQGVELLDFLVQLPDALVGVLPGRCGIEALDAG